MQDHQECQRKTYQFSFLGIFLLKLYKPTTDLVPKSIQVKEYIKIEKCFFTSLSTKSSPTSNSPQPVLFGQVSVSSSHQIKFILEFICPKWNLIQLGVDFQGSNPPQYFLKKKHFWLEGWEPVKNRLRTLRNGHWW